jgi:hypothetical protein
MQKVNQQGSSGNGTHIPGYEKQESLWAGAILEYIFRQ